MVIDRGKSLPTSSQNIVAVAGNDLHVLLWKRMDWLGKENRLEGTIIGAWRYNREDREKHEGFLPLAHSVRSPECLQTSEHCKPCGQGIGPIHSPLLRKGQLIP